MHFGHEGRKVHEIEKMRGKSKNMHEKMRKIPEKCVINAWTIEKKCVKRKMRGKSKNAHQKSVNSKNSVAIRCA